MDVFWKSWLEVHPEKKLVVEEARQVILRMHFTEDKLLQESKQRIWQTLEAVYDKQLLGKTSKGPLQVSRPIKHHWKPVFSWPLGYKIAASVTIIFMVSAVLYFFIKEYNTTTYSTQFGQTKKIILPDQSVVTLNANSTLKFPVNWHKQTNREVWLEGEAFFNVVKKNKGNIKFIVHTPKLDIEVLGTTFNVNSRRKNTVIVLNSGRVKLKSDNTEKENTLIMKPGEQVVFNEDKSAFTKKMVNAESYSAWIHQKLVFNDTPLTEIAQLLEDNYGFEVDFNEAGIVNRKFTATIPAGNINTLLTALAESFNMKITRNGNTLTFGSKL
jgi:ferric-dicitrate binding protein FerR (iron transport regulator)